MFTQAVILAGGRGARLRPITDTIPKPLVAVNGRPFIEFLIGMLRAQGVSDILLLTGYRAEQMQAVLGDGKKYGVRITYSYTPLVDERGIEQQSGTRIKNAAGLLHDNFLLLYCDNYWPMRLPPMVDYYRTKGVLATTTVYNNKDGRGEYGRENNVSVGDDGHVLLYDKTRQDPRLNGVDIGFFLLSKQILDFMPADNFSFEMAVLPRLVETRALAAYRTDHPYYTMTSPAWVANMGKFLQPKKVVFLDRDGVINKKMPPHDYVKTWREFAWLPKSRAALQLLQQRGYKIFIVTNQRGIARGLMTADDLGGIHRRMTEALAEIGVSLDGIYCCPHGNDDGCGCRKPKPGMLLQAAREHLIDLTQSVFIGDNESDWQAGEAVGCRVLRMPPNGNLLSVVQSMLV